MSSIETLGIEGEGVQLVDYSEGPLEKQKVFEYRGSNCSRKVLVHEPRVYSPLRQRVILIFYTKQNFG